MKKWYAGYNSYGIEFVYDESWTVFVFDSKKERDKFVKNYGYRDGKPVAESITRKQAMKCAPGGWWKEKPMPHKDFNGMQLVRDHEAYYNPNYWSNY